MFKLIYSPIAEIKIISFAESYKNIFIRLYYDSWLDNEYQFIAEYMDKWDELRENIKIQIHEKLSEETIFWYKLYGDWQKSVKIFLKSFMLEIFYEEDLDEKIRFIENIKISKK